MKKTFPTWCILLILFFSTSEFSFSQDTSSSRLRISLITCSPGNELYSIFGHSAIRVIDSNSVSDIVFNYGTFNFDEDFYLKFVQGKLNYYLSAANVNDFLYEYIATGRGVSEQLLDLSPQEKATIFHYLLENIKEENKFYQYDFFYNNCTTRLRDIILKAKENKPALPFVMNNKSSFRDAIHLYLRKGQQYWSELGIDLLLGAGCDKIMTAEEQEFLPNNLMNAFDGAEKNRIVKNKIELYSPSEIKNEKIWLTPFLLFMFVLFLYILLHFIKNKTGLFFLNCFDFLLYFITGVLGVVFVCMWFFTDHTMTKYNFNLLWALPFNVIACFFINSKQKIAKIYFLVYAISNALILILWKILPQQLNYSLIPIVIMLGFSAYSNYKKDGKIH